MLCGQIIKHKIKTQLLVVLARRGTAFGINTLINKANKHRDLKSYDYDGGHY